uniref:OSJNBa0032N05.12 protein n=1 Tax=Oryza sativa subsp. japonica TaxID=39947 RepID=Q5CAI6_ORYSJ|nr:OSJNBa0032N05.12 [Oryza sativa Japonica Group]
MGIMSEFVEMGKKRGGVAAELKLGRGNSDVAGRGWDSACDVGSWGGRGRERGGSGCGRRGACTGVADVGAAAVVGAAARALGKELRGVTAAHSHRRRGTTASGREAAASKEGDGKGRREEGSSPEAAAGMEEDNGDGDSTASNEGGGEAEGRLHLGKRLEGLGKREEAGQNEEADALAKSAACGGPHSPGIHFEVLYAPSVPKESLDIMAIDQAELGEDPENWRTPFMKYLKNDWLLEDEAEAKHAYSSEPQDTSWSLGSCIASMCSNPCFAASPSPKVRIWQKKYTKSYAVHIRQQERSLPKCFVRALRTTPTRPTKFSPFMLLYGDDAMTPTELGANSPRVMFSGGEDGREVSLELLEGVRVEALEHMRN